VVICHHIPHLHHIVYQLLIWAHKFNQNQSSMTYFDNISNIPEWVSDILCRAVTGSGFSKRMLFSDDDDIIYNFKRCIGFNGINLAATKADLLDRGLIIQLSKISKDKRRENKDIWTEFEKIRPQLLGYIFDILVKVLATISSVKLTELARMADFARVCETISRCMRNDPNTFIKAYDRNIQLQTEQILESNIIAPVIVKFMDDKQEWIGSATELLAKMETLAATMKVNTTSRAWPKGPQILIRRLNEVKATLEEVNIFITRGLDTKSKIKTVEIRKIPLPSLPSSQDEKGAQITSDSGNDTGNDTIAPTKVSLPNAGRNRAEIEDCTASNGSNDTLPDSTDSLRLPAYIYRLGQSDKFACKLCRIRDDKWGMVKHIHEESGQDLVRTEISTLSDYIEDAQNQDIDENIEKNENIDRMSTSGKNHNHAPDDICSIRSKK
jgi:hypothetical protein